MRRLGLGFAIGLLSWTAPGRLLSQPACAPSRVEGFLADRIGARTLSITTRAHYVLAETSRGIVGYVLLERGRPGWYKGGEVRAGGRVSGTGARVHDWHEGRISFPVTFDPDSARLEVLGVSIDLDTANVVLLDRIDGPETRRRVWAALCVQPLYYPGTLDSLLRARPALRRFAGVQAVPNPPFPRP